MPARRAMLAGILLAVCVVASPQRFAASQGTLPDRLADREYWRMIAEFSEPEGYFSSDNLVSNEDTFQHVIPELVRTVAPGGVYVGVGPDQNFTYIAAVDPAIAFVPDLRRGNLHVHLMYKALFALSATRVEFLSRLFSRPAPEGLGADETAEKLMQAFLASAPDNRLFDANLRGAIDWLARHRGAPLDEGDRAGVEYVYSSFYAAGPGLTFVSNGGFRRSRYPTYATLQSATDRDGTERAFLASEVLFQRVKRLQARNLIVPVVGNFAGPKALAAIGAWVREHGGTVTAFYTSNVEQYLFQDGAWHRFRTNVESMPMDATSTFIRSCFNSCSSPGGTRAVTLLDSMPGLLEAGSKGRISTYWDVLTHSRLP